jgi:hypothetical protein
VKAIILKSLSEAPVVVEGNTILIEDDFGNPIAVAQEVIDKRACTLLTIKDPRFHEVLARLGLDKLVVDKPLQLTSQLPASYQKLTL